MIDLTPLMRLGLLLVRPGALIVGAPAFGGVFAPAPVKIGLTLLVAIALLPSTSIPPAGASIALAGVIARELAIGLALALSIRTLVASAELAGQLVGFQMGLSYSAIVDPQSGVRNELIAALYANIAMVMFFLVNAHHTLLRALRDSYDSLPIGAGQVAGSIPQDVVGLLGLVFLLGARLAAPLVIVLVVTELGLALVARSAPALNLMVVGAPVRIIVGLILLGLVAPGAAGVLAGAARGTVQAGVHVAGAFR